MLIYTADYLAVSPLPCTMHDQTLEFLPILKKKNLWKIFVSLSFIGHLIVPVIFLILFLFTGTS